VLVTGKEFLQPKDLVWLDSCDEHRNEGVWVRRRRGSRNVVLLGLSDGQDVVLVFSTEGENVVSVVYLECRKARLWADANLTLIPVLVTGIQPPRVCAAGEFSQPKDLGWLDSCDKHRNEGVWVASWDLVIRRCSWVVRRAGRCSRG
jgi:hypothetical protein